MFFTTMLYFITTFCLSLVLISINVFKSLQWFHDDAIVAADEPCPSCETTLKRRSLTYRKFCKRDFGENMPLFFQLTITFASFP